MSECNCSMRTQLVGDGCSICNPEYARQFLSDLHLNLKGEYFNQIKSGSKKLEYRSITPRFTKIIEGKEFNNIQIKWGYPKRGDKERILIRPWKGYFKTWVTHEHFGKDAVEVYAIIVN